MPDKNKIATLQKENLNPTELRGNASEHKKQSKALKREKRKKGKDSKKIMFAAIMLDNTGNTRNTTTS